VTIGEGGPRRAASGPTGVPGPRGETGGHARRGRRERPAVEGPRHRVQEHIRRRDLDGALQPPGSAHVIEQTVVGADERGAGAS
jgi:hypothetical protein